VSKKILKEMSSMKDYFETVKTGHYVKVAVKTDKHGRVLTGEWTHDDVHDDFPMTSEAREAQMQYSREHAEFGASQH
jgi:hypothetical protein